MSGERRLSKEYTFKNLPTKKEFNEVSVKLFTDYINTRFASFQEQLTKLETIEE